MPLLQLIWITAVCFACLMLALMVAWYVIVPVLIIIALWLLIGYLWNGWQTLWLSRQANGCRLRPAGQNRHKPESTGIIDVDYIEIKEP